MSALAKTTCAERAGRPCCDQMAETLLGKPTSSTADANCGGEHTVSFSLGLSGQKRGLWHDHEAREGGDIIALVQRECGCDFSQAIDWLAAQLGVQATGNAPTGNAPSHPPARAA